MSGDMGIMEPLDHTAECALPRLHDGQCANVPPCPGTALPALADQPVRRCTKGLGHKGACADEAGELLEEDVHDVRIGEPLPQREPGAAMRCESRPGIFSGADNKPRCTLAAGHEGYHRGEEGVSWGVGAPPAASPVDDASSWIGKMFGGLGGPALKLTALNPQPVRVRFVDLPHRDVPREVDGLPVSTIEPGGFALVVDRFGTAQRCADERGRWDAFGLAVGAATVLCYPGELDIVGWLDGS